MGLRLVSGEVMRMKTLIDERKVTRDRRHRYSLATHCRSQNGQICLVKSARTKRAKYIHIFLMPTNLHLSPTWLRNLLFLPKAADLQHNPSLHKYFNLLRNLNSSSYPWPGINKGDWATQCPLHGAFAGNHTKDHQHLPGMYQGSTHSLFQNCRERNYYFFNVVDVQISKR